MNDFYYSTGIENFFAGIIPRLSHILYKSFLAQAGRPFYAGIYPKKSVGNQQLYN